MPIAKPPPANHVCGRFWNANFHKPDFEDLLYCNKWSKGFCCTSHFMGIFDGEVENRRIGEITERRWSCKWRDTARLLGRRNWVLVHCPESWEVRRHEEDVVLEVSSIYLGSESSCSNRICVDVTVDNLVNVEWGLEITWLIYFKLSFLLHQTHQHPEVPECSANCQMSFISSLPDGKRETFCCISHEADLPSPKECQGVSRVWSHRNMLIPTAWMRQAESRFHIRMASMAGPCEPKKSLQSNLGRRLLHIVVWPDLSYSFAVRIDELALADRKRCGPLRVSDPCGHLWGEIQWNDWMFVKTF